MPRSYSIASEDIATERARVDDDLSKVDISRIVKLDDLVLPEIGPRDVHLRILARTAQHRDLREPSMTIVVREGVAIPTGQVGTIGRLMFLEELLSGVQGVRQVDLSAVQVETEVGRRADDKVLHDAIFALLRNPLVFPVSGRIEVDVLDGEVTLSGEVPRLIDRMEAEFVAGLVGGVSRVENNLTIDPTRGRMRVREFSPN